MKTTSNNFLIAALSLTLLSACSAHVLDRSAQTSDEAAQSAPHKLLRQWKRVIRYDCAGLVTSDKVETVRAPNEYVAIPPKTSTNFYSSHFTNVTNGSSPGMIVGDYNFTIDMAPTALNMKVEEGVNQLKYEFYYCDQKVMDINGQPTAACALVPDIRESGSFFIKVSYEQVWLDGFDEVHPTPESCVPRP